MRRLRQFKVRVEERSECGDLIGWRGRVESDDEKLLSCRHEVG